MAYLGGIFAIHEPFVHSWGNLIQYNNEYVIEPGQMIHYDRSTISYHAFARNSLVERMFGDFILFLDQDHQYEPDLLARMLHRLEKYKIDVLTGLYLYRQKPHAPLLYKWNGTNGYEIIGKWDQSLKIFEVQSSGGGCLLVRKSVFDRIKNELGEQPFDIEHPYSEDHSFFNRLRKLGIKAYCDPRIECHHLMVKPLKFGEDYKPEDQQFAEPYSIEGFK